MAAPKGSQYAKGHGRPPKFEESEESLKEMDSKIASYFESICSEESTEPPTVTGLSYALGFADKTTLYDYKEKTYFSHLIKRALTLIEKHHEISVAYGDKCTGNIFVLKNMGWRDQKEINLEQTINQPLSPEEIDQAKKELDEGI